MLVHIDVKIRRVEEKKLTFFVSSKPNEKAFAKMMEIAINLIEMGQFVQGSLISERPYEEKLGLEENIVSFSLEFPNNENVNDFFLIMENF